VRRLSERKPKTDPNLLLGLDVPDDAAVYRINDETAIVQTVDFFTPVVDDPYQWGAIAVANALSDVYAMGATPLTGLNLVGWPKDLDMDLLARVLEGGADKADEAGCAVVGGHTVDDPEPKFGMAVTGVVHPERIVKLSTARPGMSIILTKPLGMGIIATACKAQRIDKALLNRGTRLMATLNAGAAAAMVEVGAAAATDVTGFGLIGHLRGMLAASGCSANLVADNVPILDGVGGLAKEGFVPGGTRRNEDYFRPFVDFDSDIDPMVRIILFDAQTSGGLLIVVERSKQEAMVKALRENGTPAASVIGRIAGGDPGTIRIAGRK
jgi:selenide,water dikinase